MKNKFPFLYTEKMGDLIKTMFVVFVIMQPILDIYMTLFDEYIQIAGVSLATILRFLMVFLLTAVLMLRTLRAKLTWCLAGYYVLVVIYALIHHINAVGFSVALPTAQYSAFAELLFIARLCLPPALIFITYCVKPSYTDVKRIVLWISVIMSVVIVAGNLFKFGYIGYDVGKRVVQETMLDWFRGTDTPWEYLTCRGLFQGTNQISAVMLILLPFLLHVCFKEKRVLHWVFTFMHLLAMQNLGTRVAAIASLLGFFALIFVYFLEKLLYRGSFRQDTKTYLCMALSVLLIIIVFLHSPSKKRIDQDGLTLGASTIYTEEERYNDKTPRAERLKFIEKELPTTSVNNHYILTVYPYTQDVDFWYDLLKYVPEWARIGNRNQREFLIERILELDDRPANLLWGISHTRSSSFIWPERDISCHIDSIGIVGIMLFFSPYFLGILIGIWHLLKRLRRHFKLSYYVYLCCAVLGVAAGYLAGYVLHEVFPFTMLSLMVGMTVNTALASNTKETDL